MINHTSPCWRILALPFLATASSPKPSLALQYKAPTFPLGLFIVKVFVHCVHSAAGNNPKANGTKIVNVTDQCSR